MKELKHNIVLRGAIETLIGKEENEEARNRNAKDT